jgi:uncharacterized protein YndB with AHSA1/START domain
MTTSSTSIGTFTLERTYPASPARVFHAWANLEAKKQWFSCADDWDVLEHTFDFREGGAEVWRGGPRGGTVHRNDTLYYDIVPNERIIYTCEMHLGEKRASISLMTIQIQPEGKGTRMSFTEQAVFFDDPDGLAGHEHGTSIALDKLDTILRHELALV